MISYRCTYLCPLRIPQLSPDLILEFKEYWEFLRTLDCEVLVVDGSPPKVFEVHKKEWTNCRHVGVNPKFKYLNGKVNGIMTAVPMAAHEKIILADDDIRFSAADIERMVTGLEDFDLVRPQNYFDPLPWWTRVDSGRILLNRAFIPEGDFPGSFGFRKSVFVAAGSFDGDVLFDNEELVKHLQNRGARIDFSTDFFVLRKPPTFEKWLEQRPRQAYEDFVMKKRTAFFLSLLPAHLLLATRRKKRHAALLAMAVSAFSIYKAFKGRRKGANEVMPISTTLYAPAWVLERAVSIYIALYWRLAKGGYPFGDKVVSKGTGRAWKEPRVLETKAESAISGVAALEMFHEE